MSFFTDLKTVTHRWFDHHPTSSSKDQLKDRLKLVLIHDRMGVSPETLENLKKDIGLVLSRYFDVRAEDIEIKFEHRAQNKTVLVESPFSAVHRQVFGDDASDNASLMNGDNPLSANLAAKS